VRILDPLGAEDLVEGVAELAVAIVDEESEGLRIPSSGWRWRACWTTQPPSGLEVRAMCRK
jgi:hypothetical protein